MEWLRSKNLHLRDFRQLSVLKAAVMSSDGANFRCTSDSEANLEIREMDESDEYFKNRVISATFDILSR